MKALAVNSSPRPEGQSKTALLLGHLVRGMRDARAEVEVVDLRGEKINHLSVYFKRLYGERLLAEIYRPAAEVLTYAGAGREAIFAAVEDAGRQLVEAGFVMPETLAAVAGDIAEPGLIAEVANLMWKTCIAEGVTPREFEDRGLIPRAETLEEFISIMRFVFNPAGAAGVDAVLQFDFSGPVEGCCQLKIADGTLLASMGASDKPSLVIEAPFDTWSDIMAGDEDPAQMFMEQKVTADGDFDILNSIASWFSR